MYVCTYVCCVCVYVCVHVWVYVCVYVCVLCTCNFGYHSFEDAACEERRGGARIMEESPSACRVVCKMPRTYCSQMYTLMTGVRMYVLLRLHCFLSYVHTHTHKHTHTRARAHTHTHTCTHTPTHLAHMSMTKPNRSTHNLRSIPHTFHPRQTQALHKKNLRHHLLPFPKPSTLNPQPQALNPKPSSLNPQPSTLAPTPNPKPQTQTPNPNPKPHTPNPKPQTPNPTT